MKPLQPIVFMHIPKTAGTTIHHILHNMYRGNILLTRENHKNRNALESLSNKEKEKIKVLKGHFKFGIHEQYPKPITYFTFFRDPIKRSISEYNFMHQNPKHKFYPILKENNYTLKDFLTDGHIKNFDNSHVRFLAGIDDLPFGKITEEHFNIALENFDKHFETFGITERFDESLIYIKKQFNWSFPYYVNANVSKKGNYQNKFDAETTELLNHFNKYDIKLYEYANKKFDTIIHALGEPFQKELAKFKKLNKLQSPLRKTVRDIWLFFQKSKKGINYN